jgi:hypothetical protein
MIWFEKHPRWIHISSSVSPVKLDSSKTRRSSHFVHDASPPDVRLTATQEINVSPRVPERYHHLTRDVIFKGTAGTSILGPQRQFSRSPEIRPDAVTVGSELCRRSAGWNMVSTVADSCDGYSEYFSLLMPGYSLSMSGGFGGTACK